MIEILKNNIIEKIISTLIVAGVSWLMYTAAATQAEIKLINYKIEQNNKVLQDIYETKKDK